MPDFETIAPHHELDLSTEEMQKHAYVIEGVAYSPLKMVYLHPEDRRGGERVFCESCDWETTTDDLPRDSGIVVPDHCPECAKRGELGFVDYWDKDVETSTKYDHSDREPEDTEDADQAMRDALGEEYDA